MTKILPIPPAEAIEEWFHHELLDEDATSTAVPRPEKETHPHV